MIGRSGIGKSDFLAQDDKAFFIETEAGLNFVPVMKLPARSWEDLREIYALLKAKENEKPYPYNIIVIDTIDRVVDFAEEEIITRGKEFYKNIADQINTIGDIPNGAGWAKTRELIMNFLNRLEELPCALAFIGHLQTKEVTEGVRKYSQHTINIGGKLGLDLLAFPDHILHVEATLIGDKLQRIVYTRPTQSREAKSRGGIIEDGIKWTENSKENWEKFRAHFK